MKVKKVIKTAIVVVNELVALLLLLLLFLLGSVVDDGPLISGKKTEQEVKHDRR